MDVLPSVRIGEYLKVKWVRRAGVGLGVLQVLCAGLFWFLRNPGFADPPVTIAAADQSRLAGDVGRLASITPARSIANPAALKLAAELIEAEFGKTGCMLTRHEFTYREETYHNIICSFGPNDGPRVIIGAHYDSFGRNNPGADDNASGVAGVLEIARMVARERPTLAHRLDLVAFTLEEVVEWGSDPFIANIGSYELARSLLADEAQVKLMVSVEMIGYFSTEAGSQSYPYPLSPVLSLIYPTTGDFIGVIGRAFDRSLVARVKGLMSVSDALSVYSINAPAFVPGIDRSDQRNFWEAGYPAVMVTDTAEYRNANYHKESDTPDTLDYGRMATVVEGLYRVAVEY